MNTTFYFQYLWYLSSVLYSYQHTDSIHYFDFAFNSNMWLVTTVLDIVAQKRSLNLEILRNSNTAQRNPVRKRCHKIVPVSQQAEPWAKWSFEETKDTMRRQSIKIREQNKCTEKNNKRLWERNISQNLPWVPDNFPVPYHMYLHNSLSFLLLTWMGVSWNQMIKDLNF